MKNGWHKVGDALVFVRNNVITELLMKDSRGDWCPRTIMRFNSELKVWQRTGMVTVDALRAGCRRGTICVR